MRVIDVECYNCHREGKAKVEADGCGHDKVLKESEFKSVNGKWLCKDCHRFRCRACLVLLSTTRECNKCGKKHGDYTITSFPYCSRCYKKLK